MMHRRFEKSIQNFSMKTNESYFWELYMHMDHNIKMDVR